eukprot:7823418-Pyramimonas_sp.AAC.1
MMQLTVKARTVENHDAWLHPRGPVVLNPRAHLSPGKTGHVVPEWVNFEAALWGLPAPVIPANVQYFDRAIVRALNGIVYDAIG